MDPVDTSLSISLDPSNYDHPAVANVFDTDTTNPDGSVARHAAWTTARAAAQTVFSIAGKLSAADRAIAELGRQPDPATDVRLRRSARQQMTEANKALTAAYTALTEQRAALSTEAAGLIGTERARLGVTENARGAEVRQWLRGLSVTQRTDALNEALQARDSEVVSSILAATPVLSGLKRDAHANLAEDARRVFAPRHDALIGGIDRLVSMLQTGEKALTTRFAPITGEGNSRVAAAERALSALEGGAA